MLNLTLKRLIKRGLSLLLTVVLIVALSVQPLTVLADDPEVDIPKRSEQTGYELLYQRLIREAVRAAFPREAVLVISGGSMSLTEAPPSPEAIFTGTGQINFQLDTYDSDNALIGSEVFLGTFNYGLSQADTGNPDDFDVSLSGVLQGTTHLLNMTVIQRSRRAATSSDPLLFSQNEEYTLSLAQGSAIVSTQMILSQRYRRLSTGITERVVERTSTQGGKTDNHLSRTTVRRITDQTAEVWSETTLKSPDLEPLSLRQHYWESLDETSYTQYFDSLEINAGIGGSLRLSEPGSLRLSAQGVETTLKIVDEQGNAVPLPAEMLTSEKVTDGGEDNSALFKARPLSYSDTPAPKTSAIESPLYTSTGLGLLTPCQDISAGLGTGLGGLIGALGQAAFTGGYEFADFLDGLAAVGLGAAEGGAASAARNIISQQAWGFFRGWNGVGLLWGLFGGILANAIKDRINNDPNLTPEERRQWSRVVDYLNWAIGVAIGIAALVAAPTTGAFLALLLGSLLGAPGMPLDQLGNWLGGLFGGACNADPYFIQPDIRKLPPRPQSGKARIRFATGGLYPDPQTTLLAEAPGASAPLAFNEFRDRAEAFVNGAAPKGAALIGEWFWDAQKPFNGLPSHTSNTIIGTSLHYYLGAAPVSLAAGDNIVQYVYLDPENPPEQFYLQFYTGEGDGETRVYWGTSLAQTGGVPGTKSLFPQGGLPVYGSWVRLTVSAESLGLVGQPLTGILFGAVDGRVWWGTTTTADRATDNAPEALPVSGGSAIPVSKPGAQIGFDLAQAGAVTAQIISSEGQLIKTFLNQISLNKGFHVLTWDATDNAGAPVPDGHYRIQIVIDGVVAAETSLGTEPLIARLFTPGAYSVIRGTTVPIVGEAYGAGFDQYIVEYGEGLEPAIWNRIFNSAQPAAQPAASSRDGHLNANLAVWNVGLDEFGSYSIPGLSGLYTLRLRVISKSGYEISDSAPVLVGSLAHFADGGVITSPDGQARLLIPKGSTAATFVLIAIMPAAQTEPDGIIEDILPAQYQLQGTLYEVMPANDSYLQPAMLELAYPEGSDPASLGILVGDGSPTGWRALGGQVDPEKRVIRVSLLGFENSRALVGVFSGAPFADLLQIVPPPAALTYTPLSPAPKVESNTHPVAFYHDFSADSGNWQALDLVGSRLAVQEGEVVGLPAGESALNITRTAYNGVRYAGIPVVGFDAAQYPILTLDYRVQPGDGFNVLVRSGDRWLQVDLGLNLRATTRYVHTLGGPPLIPDGQWHTLQLDLFSLLRESFPQSESTLIDSIALGGLREIAFMQVIPTDQGQVGASYAVDNIALLRPLNQSEVDLTFRPSEGTSFSGYAVTFDTNPFSAAEPVASTADPLYRVSAPAADGLYFAHVRGQTGAGWSAAAHYPVLLDRSAPIIRETAPTPNGAGNPFALTVRFDENIGIDPKSVRFTFNGQPYAVGDVGTKWSREEFTILPQLLNPPPAPLLNGASVTVEITNTLDYAGNPLVEPFRWRFTADVPTVTTQDLRQITTTGGDSPAVSPSGDYVVYAAPDAAGGRLMVVSTDNPEDVRAVDTGGLSASEPTFSPAGDQLAYLTGSGVGMALVIAPVGADGSIGTGQVTLTGANLASPSWSPDGSEIALIREGNVITLNPTAGGDPTLRTQDPERPYRSVAWSPVGSTLALGFNLYERRIELLDLNSGALRTVTQGGEATDPAWLNGSTLLYTAPTGPGLPPAIWQVNTDGTGTAPFTASADPQSAGTADGQVDVSRDGSTIVMISTRGGERQVWVKRTLQLRELDLSPSVINPGESVMVNYTLPADALVTVQLVGPNGEVIQTLAENAPQKRGKQSIPVTAPLDAKPGGLQIKLTAMIGETKLERYGEVRVEGPLMVRMPTATPMPTTAPVTTTPAAVVAITSAPLRVLALEGVDKVAPTNRIQVEIQAAAGEIVVPLSVPESLSFTLPLGTYTVRVVYLTSLDQQTLEHTFAAVELRPEGTLIEHTFPIGTLEVTAFANQGGTTLATDLSVDILTPDGVTTLGTATGQNPAGLTLPAGVYDVRLRYLNSAGEAVTYTFEDVTVRAGASDGLFYPAEAGEVSLTVYAAPGVKATTDSTLEAYAPGDTTQKLASVDFTNPLVLKLQAGTYDLRLIERTDLATPLETIFPNISVQPGRRVNLEHTFPTGQLELATFTMPETKTYTEPRILVYAPGDRETLLGDLRYKNPYLAVLPVGAYDLVVELETNLNQKLNQVFEGVVITAGAVTKLEHTFPTGQLELTTFTMPETKTYDSPKVLVYAPGDRETVLGDLRYENPQTAVLPVGTYDLVVELATSLNQPLRHTFEKVEITAGAVTKLEHTFPTGQLELTTFTMPETKTYDSPKVLVYAPGDRETVLGDLRYENPQTAVLPVGTYDLVVELATSLNQPLRHTFEKVEIAAGAVTKLEHTFPSGALELATFVMPGVPTYNSPKVLVYAPGDRETLLADLRYENPQTAVLPVGVYDLVVELETNLRTPTRHTFEAVEIKTAQVTKLEHTFPAGQVKVTALDASGQPLNPSDLTLEVLAVGTTEPVIGQVLYANPLIATLPEGTYDLRLKVGGKPYPLSSVTIKIGEVVEINQSITP